MFVTRYIFNMNSISIAGFTNTRFSDSVFPAAAWLCQYKQHEVPKKVTNIFKNFCNNGIRLFFSSFGFFLESMEQGKHHFSVHVSHLNVAYLLCHDYHLRD